MRAFIFPGNSVSLCTEISNVLSQFKKPFKNHGASIHKGRAGRQVSAYNNMLHATAGAVAFDSFAVKFIGRFRWSS